MSEQTFSPSTTPNYNSIVAKHNELIPQMAKFELSELRLIAFCLAHYDSREAGNRIFKARISDFYELFPIDHKSAYAVIRNVMIGLGKKPLEVHIENRRQYRNWFSGFDYIEGTGEFEFMINPDVEPYLLKLKKCFTYYRIKDVYQFKAASTWKLYELLKRWEATGKWDVELDDLRLMLGKAGQYPLWNNLRNRVLNPAVKEINEVSDIVVSYEKKTYIRRVVGLMFRIKPKNPSNTTALSIMPEGETLEQALIRYGINKKTAKEYSYKAEEQGLTNVIVEKLPGIVERSEKKDINAQKYILGAVNNEINQQVLPGFRQKQTPKKPMIPDYQESLDCWQEKRRTGEKCKVRIRGEAGQRKKCQICLEKLNPDDGWGI